jgi:tRNA 2-thiouridine synthesizing protein A
VSEARLDARRLLCPMPVIRTQQQIEQMQPGDTLAVVCTDPGVVHDIPAWCRVNGHEVLEIVTDAGEITVRIRVCEA